MVSILVFLSNVFEGISRDSDDADGPTRGDHDGIPNGPASCP